MKKHLPLLMLLLLISCNSEAYKVDALTTTCPTALIFLSTECPISEKYIAIINQLSAEYPKVRFIGVFPMSETKAALHQFKQANNLKFSVMQDRNGALARHFGATHTPEVYLLSTDNKVLYFGAIDNWYYDLEQLHREPTDHFLKKALDSYFQHKSIFVKDTRPVGCPIDQ